MKQKNNRIDAFGKVLIPQAADGLIHTVLARDIADVGAHPSVQQHLNGPQGVVIAIPAHRHRAAVPGAQPDSLIRQTKARRCKIGNDLMIPAQG